VILYPGQNFEQALSDLAGFEKIWLLYVFDRNKNWKPQVLPPHGSATKRGVFATRSPHRPNPIGLSLVELVSIKGRTLEVANLDLLDRTPILDIKPYLPGVEAHPDARTGWTRGGEEPRLVISWAYPEARDHSIERHLQLTLPVELLEQPDLYPLPHPYKRIERLNDNLFVMAKGVRRITFSITNGIVTITEVT
jgi:tRNA (adenine37-N6)-methyltransferase